MNYASLGDLSGLFQTRRNSVAVKTELNALANELTTGRLRDTGAAVRGDVTELANIERRISVLDAYKSATTELDNMFVAGQQALELSSNIVSTQAAGLAKINLSSSGNDVDLAAGSARAAFSDVISALNTNAGGRAIFAGTAWDQAPLASAADMLADLTVAAAGLTDAQDVITTVDAWFDHGGGFDTSGYLGSTVALAESRVGETTTLEFSARADDPAIRETLKGLALGALVDEGVLSADGAAQRQLLTTAGTQLFGANSRLIDMQAHLGQAQERLENTKVANAATGAALELSRNNLLSADPFETATKLEQMQSQLEMMYTITSRLSRLSLADYI